MCLTRFQVCGLCHVWHVPHSCNSPSCRAVLRHACAPRSQTGRSLVKGRAAPPGMATFATSLTRGGPSGKVSRRFPLFDLGERASCTLCSCVSLASLGLNKQAAFSDLNLIVLMLLNLYLLESVIPLGQWQGCTSRNLQLPPPHRR